MKVSDAKARAARWVRHTGMNMPTVVGAYWSGSVNWLPDTAQLPVSSDVDICLVVDDEPVPDNLGKFRHDGVVLDVSFLPGELLRRPERVLADYHLAGSFHHGGIIADPAGILATAHRTVAAGYHRREWVLRRCEHVRDRIVDWAGRFDPTAPLAQRVIDWVFPTGVVCHLLLVAGLQNPTVRRRYVLARDLLTDHGRADFHRTLLEQLGCHDLSSGRVAYHLGGLAAAFDAAAATTTPGSPWSRDLAAAARPIVIDGSAELIAADLHREAVFWMVATWAKCLAGLEATADPAVVDRHRDGLWELLTDLAVEDDEALRDRAAAVTTFLPHAWRVALDIVSADPRID